MGRVEQVSRLGNKVADLFGGHKTHAPKAAKPAERKAESPKPATAHPPPEDMAAIAAAVSVVMDGTPHRIINIEPNQGNAWVQGGRMAQHGSHAKVHRALQRERSSL